MRPFACGECAAIQTLHRLDPVLLLSPGRAERHSFEYYRHGTLSLYAAFDTRTGKVPARQPHARPVKSRVVPPGVGGTGPRPRPAASHSG